MFVDYIVLGIGISGVLAITINFLLEATNHLPKDHHLFAWINLYGSLALLVYSWYNAVWLFVVLNMFTTIAALYGLRIVYFTKKSYF